MNKQLNKRLNSKYKKYFIIVAASLVALVLLYSIGFISFGKFRTITYDNGNGAKYKLTFYSKHSAAAESPPLYRGEEYKALNSRYSINGKDPISLTIRSYALDRTDIYQLSETCEAPMSKLVTVFNNSINKEINICAESTDPRLVTFYFATFSYESKKHLVSISQKLDFSSTAEGGTDAAQVIEDKLGLEAYTEDIKSIVSSIKPVQ